MTDVHNSFRRLSASIVGVVFFVSGMLKLMDPVGASLVVSEYMKFFGTGFLAFLSMPAAAAMALLETLTGAALVTGVFRKTASFVSCAMLMFFTFLTAVFLVTDPEMDCGCFGEAIHLTHLQSFLKNVVLSSLAAFAFIPFREYGAPSARKFWSFSAVAVISVCVLAYTSAYLPLTDFTTFRLSTSLAASEVAADGGEDRYEAVFIYEKKGTEEAFPLENLPDSTWTFVRSEIRSGRDGAQDSPALSIFDANGQYFDYLAADGPVMIVSVYDAARLGGEYWNGASAFVRRAEDSGFRVLVLLAPSASPSDLFSGAGPEERMILGEHVFNSDFKSLVSLNRSNGGVSYFSDGQLVQRWASRSMPDDALLSGVLAQDSIDRMLSHGTRRHLTMQATFLFTFALMLLL